MTTDDRNDDAKAGNVGLMRPPLIYLAMIVSGLLLHYLSPARFVPPAVNVPLGVGVVLAAVALFIAAVRTFRAADTPVPGNLPTTAIVDAGPYRWTRNPIYLAFSLLQLGVACWVNSVWLLVTLVPAVSVMSLVVIPREEKYLAKHFPAEYLPYKSKVRRWI